MDIIQKAILFGGKAIVSVVDATELTRDAARRQQTNDPASEVLGRVLAIGAFLGAGIKGTDIKLSITIDGGGKCGKIIVAGETGGVVRGFVQERNPEVTRLADGKYNISECVGSNGSITVIKDFGLKNPYIGRTQLVNGNIDSDFAYYFTTSEGLPSALASGCVVKDGDVKACGMIIVQPMPNCEEEYIVILQDIVRNFTDFGTLIESKSATQIIDDNFGHFEHKLMPPITPKFECKCSEERMRNIIKSLDRAEVEEILRENGQVEIHCDFCNKYYRYKEEQIKEIFANK
ncbi:MAG: Hsp33 family molecular chaperone HslO [Clostridia bacterium]|nr:Hsp33 family molecular chaperone HslO [Clostridia bacterium]